MSGKSARHSVLESAGSGLWQTLLADTRAGSPSGPHAGEATAIDLREELANPRSETLAEVVQHLRDLGYLETKPAAGPAGLESAAGAKSLLSRALSAFAEDLAGFDRWFDISAVRGWGVSHYQAPATPFPSDSLVIPAGAVLRLRALTSIDGVIVFREAPADGETSLASRVAKHLLHIYGVLPERARADSPWDKHSAAALRYCGVLLNLHATGGTPLGILNHLANFDSIEANIANLAKEWNLSIPAPTQGDWSVSINSQGRLLDRFQKAVERTIDGENIIFDVLDRSSFGIRLLQVFLWQSGHYFGELDGLWGQQSDAALFRAAIVGSAGIGGGEDLLHGIVNETGGTISIDLPETLRRLGERQTRVFHSAAKGPSSGPADDLGKIQFAIRERLEEIGSWKNTNTAQISKQEAVTWNRLYEEVDTGPVQNDSGTLRVNYGMRSLADGVDWLVGKMRDIVSGVKAWFKSFVEGVRRFVDELVDAISGAALQAFRFLKRGLSGAIRVATLAGRRVLRMIRGEPFANVFSPERWIFTRFYVDQDAVVFCSGSIAWQELSGHYQNIAVENRSLESTLVLGIRVLRILAAVTATPVAGIAAIRLALDIFRTFSRMPAALPAPQAAAKGLRVAASSAPRDTSRHLPPPVLLTA